MVTTKDSGRNLQRSGPRHGRGPVQEGATLEMGIARDRCGSRRHVAQLVASVVTRSCLHQCMVCT
jgi:hypothetical protein